MTYTLLIAVVVFLALPAAAAAVRIAAHCRYGAHGRPDLEAGHSRDFRPAERLVRSRCPLLRVPGIAPSETRTPAREAVLVPVPAAPKGPADRRPSPTWAYIHKEFDLDTPDHRDRAA